MKQFQWGVTAYVAAQATLIMLPALVLFTSMRLGDVATLTIYSLPSCVRWLFLAALCWICRCEVDLSSGPLS